jgi:hypothetical protein
MLFAQPEIEGPLIVSGEKILASGGEMKLPYRDAPPVRPTLFPIHC